eukprot:scaffold80671_cov34-Phaeocystis_antarctica.AAC.1
MATLTMTTLSMAALTSPVRSARPMRPYMTLTLTPNPTPNPNPKPSPNPNPNPLTSPVRSASPMRPYMTGAPRLSTPSMPG